MDDVDVAQQIPKIMTSAMAQASYNMTDVSDVFAADLMVAGVAAANKIGTSASAVVPKYDRWNHNV